MFVVIINFPPIKEDKDASSGNGSPGQTKSFQRTKVILAVGF